MILPSFLAGLAVLSLGLLFWQWIVAIRFPLHQRIDSSAARDAVPFAPSVTILKPLKGCDEFTEVCLRSWFEQEYHGSIQFLLGVASADDPVCALVHKLIDGFPARDARLLICGPPKGANPKVSTLVELERAVAHAVIIVSDADVRVPRDFLANAVAPLRQEEVGLVNCFYRLANPVTTAMQWEAVAINADFWSQVLQALSLKSLDFALGAVMVARAASLREIGGFSTLIDCLADDYQLGHRIAESGARIELSPVVVECWSAPMKWGAVWKHQVRWARTIRVCQPVPYFFSIVSNPTFWPLLWFVAKPAALSGSFVAAAVLLRLISAHHLQSSLAGAPPGKEMENAAAVGHYSWWMPPIKDLLQLAIWICAFLGNEVEWRGERLRLRRDGTLIMSGGAQSGNITAGTR
jgi:ceramide glucosyltransferase